MAARRLAEQSIETCAVCPRCSRVSNNPKVCDRCGGPLSEASATACYSSQPKQVGTTDSTNPAASMEGDAALRAHSINRTASMEGSNSMAAQPVPQALYVNSSNLRPQTLYLNMTNSIPLQQQQQQQQPQQPQHQQQQPVSVATSVVNQTQAMVINSSAVNSLSSGTVVATSSNVRPGPPALVPVTVNSRGTPGMPPPYPGGNSQGAVATAPPPLQSQQQTPAPSTDSNSSVGLSLEVHQIRVGTRKFMPASSVAFKDDGVLFTLREYTNAPLLLNARAIIRCKACLSPVHPILFFMLEASCVKQIRAIFHMSEVEFNDKDLVLKKRCITVFPKNLTAGEVSLIQMAFNNMKAKFGRSDILEHIDTDAAVDILYGASAPTSGTSNSSGTSSSNFVVRGSVTNGHGESNNRQHPYTRPQQQPQQQQLPQQAHPQQQQPPAQQHPAQMGSTGASQLLQSMNTMQRQVQANSVRGLPQAPNSVRQDRGKTKRLRNDLQESVQRRTESQPGRLSSSQPLIIPQDPVRWQQMRKSLVVNAVYPVQSATDLSRKVNHYVWNGRDFIPCQVQENEVHVQCSAIRIGSLKAQSAATVIVRFSHGRTSFTFQPKLPDSSTVSISVYEDDMKYGFACFERIAALFLFTSESCAHRIRSVCKMKNAKDPTYSPGSREERQKHLILFLRDVTPEQRAELLKIKHLVPPQKPLLQEIDANSALKILSSIKQNSYVQGKISDYMPGGPRALDNVNGTDLQSLEALAREIGQDDSTAAEDDDDVIMTSEELTIKCPYTQSVMQEPVKNRHCGHNYEKRAIIEFIARRRAKGADKNAKCPYAGCGNQTPLRVEDLDDNPELKEYIRSKTS